AMPATEIARPVPPLPSAGEGRGEGEAPEVPPRNVATRPQISPAYPHPLPKREGTSGAGRILVVDDTPANRDMLSRRLERHGFDVQTAEDGEAALQLLSPAAAPVRLGLLGSVM